MRAGESCSLGPNTLGPLPVTAVILTRNEHRNLPACLESLVGKASRCIVVDSFSDDDTVQIAERYGATVLQHEFRNHAEQLEWALRNAPIQTEWVMRVDADERWTESGWATLGPLLSDPQVAGIHVSMRIMFMGRFLRYGGLYPNLFLRVFRRASARVERRWMDEHVSVSGEVVAPGIDVIEANYDRQHNIGLWTAKHNAYSTREAIDLLLARHRSGVDTIANLWGDRTARKRWLKERVYARAPLFVRPFAYAAYRYVVRLGFLDGVPGFVFHVLQGFWYRFLVDVKIYQLEALAKRSGRSIEDEIEDAYGIRIG